MLKQFIVIATVLCAGLVSLATLGAVSAQGLPPGTPIPMPPVMPPRPWPIVHLQTLSIETTIRDQVASTRVVQVFRNQSDRELEGTYLFPLPEDASISGFAMEMDGVLVKGEVMDKDKARSIYEGIVRQRRDPALLEYVGRGLFTARVFPIAPKSDKRIELRYTQVLRSESGLVKYVFPLGAAKAMPVPFLLLPEDPTPAPMPVPPIPMPRPDSAPIPPTPSIPQLAISVELTTSQPLQAVYSPSHQVALQRPSANRALVSYEESNVTNPQDFQLLYSAAAKDVSLSLLPYRDGVDDGFFLLLLSPRLDLGQDKTVAKDVVFVVDVSGSMRGEKMEQARRALRFVVQRLNADDRFNIIAFSSFTKSYAEALAPAAEAGEAKTFIDSLVAEGGTNIEAALREGLSFAGGQRPFYLIFLTDGQPTVGVIDTPAIIASARSGAKETARLFTFGVGYDVNTVLLDTLAQEMHGASDYVRPGEDLERKVTAFYEKVSTPVLTNLSLDFGAVKVSQLFPSPLPDLFQGGQLIVAGRYSKGGTATLTLTGLVDGATQRFTFPDIAFPEKTTENDFVPRVWAQRKVGYLLNQLRLRGQNQEVIDEIKALGTRYGIVTPYTSFLVLEPSFQGGIPQTGAPRGIPQPTASPAPLAAPAPTAASGQGAVTYSQAVRDLQEAASAGQAPSSVRRAGDKTFLLQDGRWVDTAYRPGTPTTALAFGGSDYFRLLRDHSEWGKYLAVAERMVVVLEGRAYDVVPGASTPIAEPMATPSPVATIAPVSTPAPDSSDRQNVVTTGVEPQDQASPVVRFFKKLWGWLKAPFD